MAKKKGPSIHVVPSSTKPGKFVAKVEGNPKPITRPSSQAKAIEKAIPVAKQNQSEVVIHGRDGKIRAPIAMATIRILLATRSTNTGVYLCLSLNRS